MSDLNVRRAEPRDLPELHDAQRRTIIAFCAPFYETETLETFLASGGLVAEALVASGSYRVIARGPRIVGGAGWTDGAPGHPAVTPAADAWLRGVFIVPEESGRGTGQSLVASVLADVQAAGRPRVDLLATLNAVPFYRRLGWRSIRAISLPMDGTPEMATVWMTRIEPHPLRRAA